MKMIKRIGAAVSALVAACVLVLMMAGLNAWGVVCAYWCVQIVRNMIDSF